MLVQHSYPPNILIRYISWLDFKLRQPAGSETKLKQSWAWLKVYGLVLYNKENNDNVINVVHNAICPWKQTRTGSENSKVWRISKQILLKRTLHSLFNILFLYYFLWENLIKIKTKLNILTNLGCSAAVLLGSQETENELKKLSASFSIFIYL